MRMPAGGWGYAVFWSLLVCVGANAEMEGQLLYVGRYSNGWQVCRYDVALDKAIQLTTSVGDKRSPQYALNEDRVVFRDASGLLKKLTDSQEVPGSRTWAHALSTSSSRTGRRYSDTWQAAGNPKRHHIWRRGLHDASSTLYKRPDDGSFSHLAMSLDGRMLVATHIYDFKRERLVLFSLRDNASPVYLTPETASYMFPSLRTDGIHVLCSRKVGPTNYDLYEFDLSSQQMSPVLESEDVSECRPVSDKSGTHVFFEQRTGDGTYLAVLTGRPAR